MKQNIDSLTSVLRLAVLSNIPIPIKQVFYVLLECGQDQPQLQRFENSQTPITSIAQKEYITQLFLNINELQRNH